MTDPDTERPGAYSYDVTVPRDLAEAIVGHYGDEEGVSSVPDALRAAARDVLTGD